MRLDEFQVGLQVKGLIMNQVVTIRAVERYGNEAVDLTYMDEQGRLGYELLYQQDAESVEIVKEDEQWAFDADGELFRLISEAYRIRMAHLFDPLLAVHTSAIEPLPHQIAAVYEEMLPKHPLRFLLADDPGAGKTVMAGLLLKELILRGDVQRCLICTPGNLVEQWQEELLDKFQLSFRAISSHSFMEKGVGNPFQKHNWVICRLDHLSRNEQARAMLEQTEWDMIIVDEAHKMSASFFGGEFKATKRYRLGELFSRLTRHLLLLTATPHNGKEEDFQLFLNLLDEDRFAGRFRTGIRHVDVRDIMRRLTKEQLLTFQGRPLFPERRAYTVSYRLSPEEEALYQAVTHYVRDQWNRIERLKEKKRTVSFALTILQRRLASSPEAIYQSLLKRRTKLQKRLALVKQELGLLLSSSLQKELEIDEWESEEEQESEIVSQATSARTIAELEAEIEVLEQLERQAKHLRNSGKDRKWEELSLLLQQKHESHHHCLYDDNGQRKKLVIFTEYRDTLEYLAEKIRSLIGRKEAVVVIHGQTKPEQRRRVQKLFNEDPNVEILLATDAASEGINLHNGAHLMVNYDLPWNPNRLEQRFGRIHRIGQTEVCHLWNLVAENTREGDVYQRLLSKLETARKALNGTVYDVLGTVFYGNRLRDLLIQAVRYGDRQDVRQRLYQEVDAELDQEKLSQLLEKHALFTAVFDEQSVQSIRHKMTRANVHRLQPNFIEAFFVRAFQALGGAIREREPRRYELNFVPQSIRQASQEPLPSKYQRICFEPSLMEKAGRAVAEFISLGHPLLEAVLDQMIAQYQALLKKGAILVDERAEEHQPRLLFYIESEIVDGSKKADGEPYVVAKRIDFLEQAVDGTIRHAGFAPYLDYRELQDDERLQMSSILSQLPWQSKEMEQPLRKYVVQQLLPPYLKQLRQQRREQIAKIRTEVKDRLSKEIHYWDRRAIELQEQERLGHVHHQLNSQNAKRTADRLQARYHRRLAELDREERLSPRPPRIIGRALIIPQNMFQQQQEEASWVSSTAAERQRIEQIAMKTVMKKEQEMGYQPTDVSALRLGYDIESLNPQTGELRFIEVKGRVAGATSITVTRNEVFASLNNPEHYWLAVVEIKGEEVQKLTYRKAPFRREPDFHAASINYHLPSLLTEEDTSTWQYEKS